MHQYSNAVVVGAIGGRPDHSLSNLSILKKYHKRIRLLFSDSFCDIQIVEPKDYISVSDRLGRFRCCRWADARDHDLGARISLAQGIARTGRAGRNEQRVVSSPVKISVKKGSLLLFIVKPK